MTLLGTRHTFALFFFRYLKTSTIIYSLLYIYYLVLRPSHPSTTLKLNSLRTRYFFPISLTTDKVNYSSTI